MTPSTTTIATLAAATSASVPLTVVGPYAVSGGGTPYYKVVDPPQTSASATTATLKLTVSPTDSSASVYVNSTLVTGTATLTLPKGTTSCNDFGLCYFTVNVTSSDGSASAGYGVYVHMAYSLETRLLGLAAAASSVSTQLTPAFSPSTSQYGMEVEFATSTVNLTATYSGAAPSVFASVCGYDSNYGAAGTTPAVSCPTVTTALASNGTAYGPFPDATNSDQVPASLLAGQNTTVKVQVQSPAYVAASGSSTSVPPNVGVGYYYLAVFRRVTFANNSLANVKLSAPQVAAALAAGYSQDAYMLQAGAPANSTANYTGTFSALVAYSVASTGIVPVTFSATFSCGSYSTTSSAYTGCALAAAATASVLGTNQLSAYNALIAPTLYYSYWNTASRLR